jgi:hypothetical protein
VRAQVIVKVFFAGKKSPFVWNDLNDGFGKRVYGRFNKETVERINQHDIACFQVTVY